MADLLPAEVGAKSTSMVHVSFGCQHRVEAVVVSIPNWFGLSPDRCVSEMVSGAVPVLVTVKVVVGDVLPMSTLP